MVRTWNRKSSTEDDLSVSRDETEITDFWELDMIRVIADAYRAARLSSAKKSVPFDLTVDELNHMMRRSLGRCEISGIKFSGDNFSVSRRRPFVPSIDRINSKKPYSLDNCRLVSWIVNLAISDWGEDVFWLMVKASGKKGRYSGLADETDSKAIEQEISDLFKRVANWRYRAPK